VSVWNAEWLNDNFQQLLWISGCFWKEWGK
jgi:hypothetical protein